MRRGRMPACFEHIAEADQVGLHVVAGLLYGVAHPCLRGQVDDAVETAVRDQLRQPPPVAQVQAFEPEAVPSLEKLQSRPL